MSPEPITSRTNKRVQHFRALAGDRQTRHAEGLFLCEGALMLGEALRSGAAVDEILYDDALDDDWRGRMDALHIPAWAVIKSVLACCSSAADPPNLVFTVRIPAHSTPSAPPPHGGRYLLLDALSDPGNVGTILRSADAFALDGLFLTRHCADIYSPKTVRATMGSIFRVPVYSLPFAEIRAFLSAHRIPLVGAVLHPEAEPASPQRLRRACIAIGNEAHGLTPDIVSACDRHVTLPMPGRAESLNAAVAAGILCYLTALA